MKSNGPTPRARPLTRRRFLKASGGALAGAYLLGLAGCGDTGSQEEGEAQMSFLSVYDPPQTEKLEEIVNDYESNNPRVSIDFQPNPDGDFNQWFQTRLASGDAPDIQRINYPSIGLYSSQGALVDLTEYLDEGYGDAFASELWATTTYEGGIYGIPLITDAVAVMYNADYFEQLGIEVPQSLEESWDWDQFIEVARRLKDESDAEYAFAHNYGGPGTAYRWLPFLYQAGGQLLSDDLQSPQIDTPEGIEAISWVQSWFQDDLVPPGQTIKGQDPNSVVDLFANGNIGMMIHGSWMMSYLRENMTDFRWGATYMPRSVEMATDMGGSALAVTRDTENPEVAADFIEFVCNEENMREFILAAEAIPPRTSIREEGLDYEYRPEVVDVFVEQSTTIPENLAQVVSTPSFNRLNQVLEDELDLAWIGEQDAETTARRISEGLEEILSE